MIIYLHYANVYIHGLEIHLTLMNGFKFNKIKIMHLCRYMYVVSKLIVLRQFFLLISKKSGRVFYSLQVLKVHSINCIKSMKTTQYFFFWMSFFIRLQYTAKKKKKLIFASGIRVPLIITKKNCASYSEWISKGIKSVNIWYF